MNANADAFGLKENAGAFAFILGAPGGGGPGGGGGAALSSLIGVGGVDPGARSVRSALATSDR